MTRRKLVFWFAVAGGGVLFVQSIRAVGFAAIVTTLAQVGWGFGAILFMSGLREILRTLAWMRTTEGPANVPFVNALRARLAGEALSTLLPMGVVVGEPTKAAQIGGGIPFATAFRGLAVEFAFFCVSVLPLMAAGAIAVAAVEHASRRAFLVGLVGAAGAVSVLFAARPRTPGLIDSNSRAVDAPNRPSNLIARASVECRRLRDAVTGFASRHPERVWPLMALETGYQVLTIAEVYVTLVLISPSRPTLASALVLETVNRVITVVFQILPMRVGVDEGSAALSARRLDLGAATGVSLALVRKLRLLFWSTVGLVLLTVPHSGRSPSLGAAAVAE